MDETQERDSRRVLSNTGIGFRYHINWTKFETRIYNFTTEGNIGMGAKM